MISRREARLSATAALALLLLASACGAKTGLHASDFERDDAAAAGGDAGGYGGGPHCGDPRHIYFVNDEGVLKVFDPGTGLTTSCWALDCPEYSFRSMAINREGVVYVETHDEDLFRTSIFDASCEPTSYIPDALGELSFGGFEMAFVPNVGTASETLYIAGEANGSMPIDPGKTSIWLGSIDTTSFSAQHIASLSPPASAGVGLTGTPDGRLFAVSLNYFFELDRSTGQILGEPIPIPLPPDTSTMTLAFWGGDFYIFNDVTVNPPPAEGTYWYSIVVRYRPSDGSFATVMTFPHDHIYGVGVPNFGAP